MRAHDVPKRRCSSSSVQHGRRLGRIAFSGGAGRDAAGRRAVTDDDGKRNGSTAAAATETLVAASPRRRVGPPPLLTMRYDRVNLNVHSVLPQLRSNEPLAPR